MEDDGKYPFFYLASFCELSNVRHFSDRFVWSVAQALIRREKGETRNKLNKKWNLSLAMRVGDDYSPALVFLRKGYICLQLINWLENRVRLLRRKANRPH
jgi:hypothetical protein